MSETKLIGICRFCKNVDKNIYGEYCLKAHFRDHGGGYGRSWSSNECKHDQHHTPMKDLFYPTDGMDESLLFLRANELKLNGEILKLKEENRKLRDLV
jgi:hypothetical protein